MPDVERTCWSVILDAARGDAAARERFARLYAPVIRTTLEARWHDPVRRGFVEDAIQDVFVECLRDGGALARADSHHPGGFRAFLHGVVRNVARRHEERLRQARERQSIRDPALEDVAADEESPSLAFDRAWAMALLREARERLEEHAREAGAEGLRRVELLRLRFAEGKPIREVAVLWDVDPAGLHNDLRHALREFKAALREVVREHHPIDSVDAECSRLLEFLGD